MRVVVIMIVSLLPSCRGFFLVFGCRLSLLVGFSVCLLCHWGSAVSCDFGVSIRRGDLASFYSTFLCPLKKDFSFQNWRTGGSELAAG